MKTTLFALLMFSLVGCMTNKLQTGTYKVTSVKKFNGKSVVMFEGINKEYILPTDSIKKNDVIFITATTADGQNVKNR